MDDAIRPARADDIPALNRIERLTDTAHFTGILKNPDRLPLDSSELLESACDAGLLWVAADAADAPVGYCFVRLISRTPHIEEVSVHPDHGRRGLGRRLVEAALAGARAAGHRRVTLTAFRELPWNGPFYAKLGFAEVPAAQASPDYRALLDEEARELVPDPAYPGLLTRVLMACDLT
jgi:GNAT superfamily N-acetyltransferase